MELDKIRELKAELEDNILDLLVKFEKETDVTIDNIVMKVYASYCYPISSLRVIESVKVKCEV